MPKASATAHVKMKKPSPAAPPAPVAGTDARAQALAWLEATLTRRAMFEDAQTVADATLAPRDRALAHNLTLTTLRRLGQIDAVLGKCLKSPDKLKGTAYDVLRLAAAQLLFLQTPVHAVQATALELARRNKMLALKALFSGVIHRIAREGKELLAATDAVGDNIPSWLWQSWVNAYGHDGASKIAAGCLDTPPLDLTVKSDPTLWAQKLKGTLTPAGTVRLRDAGPVMLLEGYEEGAWWVQDAAAAFPVKMLGDLRGKTVLDLCAAPGGKTAQLILAGAAVTAVDSEPTRVARLNENLARLKLEAHVVCADLLGWEPAAQADVVLLDAPCTATGTLRRHPDLMHRKRLSDIKTCALVQEQLLARAATFVKPGGVLLYAVCSLQPEECEQQVNAFLAKHKGWQRVPVKGREVYHQVEFITSVGDLRCLPSHWTEHGGLDGFYAAKLTHGH